MKLELKHLTDYLPYGLKMQYTHTGKIGTLRNVFNAPEYDDVKLSIDYADGEHIWMFKPVLEPLMIGYKECWELGLSPYCESIMSAEGGLAANINSCPFEDVQLLLSHHFDVFGLIPAGLAIDINTIG